ncbi:NADP-dependent leukotriene B4 12-hydroxydehydrogenase [Penicillium brasilianum]|uniref:NADP-dependent leukotriene B4 12-hydroxydehydrogenase n=1 Tax=Penicillium brasilianum TaxID=104259 RepID=A0A1S9RCL8_PENBI|nr:NADP-dependent leukotriene B4 12-hydroxydehydrogenase [Penicillium brasilianum]
MVKTRQWVLRNRATDQPILKGPDATFALITSETGVPNDGQVLIKTLCFSNDPSQRGWIDAVTDNERLYVPLLPQGSPMPAYALAEIFESRTDSLNRGDLVRVWTGWSEYAVVDAQLCTKLPLLPNRLSPTHHLGALGITGLTAFFGMTDVAQATKDDVVVVSGAAGATGSMAVQIAKNVIGCKKVIGIAGSDSKCKWVESLGADMCLNYKSSTFPEELAQVTPEFVNVYFDNAGGDILSLLFTRMARYGRIAACGAIANYNHASNRSIGVKNWFEVVAMRLQIKGFVVKDYTARFEEALQVLMNALAEGKLKIDSEVEHVIESDFENVPVVWMKLFTGANQGKLITRL